MIEKAPKSGGVVGEDVEGVEGWDGARDLPHAPVWPEEAKVRHEDGLHATREDGQVLHTARTLVASEPDEMIGAAVAIPPWVGTPQPEHE